MASGLKSRISRLEQETAEHRPWHQIIQDLGQSQDEAIADYEATIGQIPEDDNILLVVIV